MNTHTYTHAYLHAHNNTYSHTHPQTHPYTGSSSGLGANTAKLFAALGCKLSLHGRSDEGIQRTKQTCLDAGSKEHNVRITCCNIYINSQVVYMSLIYSNW